MPFTKNQIITLEIEALSNDGNGVAHKDGKAVFVPLTAPGDVAEVRIVKPMKTYAFGRVEKLLTAGPGRVRQDCPVAGPCGGCLNKSNGKEFFPCYPGFLPTYQPLSFPFSYLLLSFSLFAI